jgi:hypothetical protein
VHDGSATTKALIYSLNAWEAPTRNLLDGEVTWTTTICEHLIRSEEKHGCSRAVNWPASAAPSS